MTFDEVKDAFTSFVTKYDSNVIEKDQAIAAAQKALDEQTQDQTAEVELAVAVDDLKAKAAAYGTDPAVTLDDVLAAAQVAVVSNGKHVIEHQEAADAIATAINEQAEADASTAEAQTALDAIKQALDDFTL